MPTTSRRCLLATIGGLGAGALAGCATLGTDRRSALEYQLTIDDVEELTTRALWTPPDRDDPRSAVGREAWQAVTSGDRYTTYGYEPVPEGYTEREGSYYHVDAFVTGSQRMRRPFLRLEWLGRVDELESVPEHVEKDDLPEIDQGAVMSGYFAARSRELGGRPPRGLTEDGGYVYRHLDRAESELAPNPEHDHVRVQDTILEVSVRRRWLVEPAYTATATEVATSREAFLEIADAKLVTARIDQGSLSEDARDLFERAEAPDGLTRETPLEDPFRALLRALDLEVFLDVSRDDAASRATNRNYLQYGDDYYEYALYVNEAG